jgi:hypothetical protein
MFDFVKERITHTSTLTQSVEFINYKVTIYVNIVKNIFYTINRTKKK